MPKLRNDSKGGFETGLSRLRFRHSTTELPRSTTSTLDPGDGNRTMDQLWTADIRIKFVGNTDNGLALNEWSFCINHLHEHVETVAGDLEISTANASWLTNVWEDWYGHWFDKFIMASDSDAHTKGVDSSSDAISTIVGSLFAVWCGLAWNLTNTQQQLWVTTVCYK